MPYKNPEDKRKWDLAYSKVHREKRNKYYRRRNLLWRHGLTEEEYEAKLFDQSGVCMICLKPDEKGRRLYVDHNHETGKIRGLLCLRCNVGLGSFRDADELLDRAADYLRRWE